jgi:hypothetical protein
MYITGVFALGLLQQHPQQQHEQEKHSRDSNDMRMLANGSKCSTRCLYQDL